eukprot:4930607-Amphidinium_carterae.1
MGLRHMLRTHHNFGCHLVQLVDNLPLALTLSKGRGKHQLNGVCRQFCSYLLASGCWVHSRWIPSELNVADKPSRWAASLRKSEQCDNGMPTGSRCSQSRPQNQIPKSQSVHSKELLRDLGCETQNACSFRQGSECIPSVCEEGTMPSHYRDGDRQRSVRLLRTSLLRGLREGDGFHSSGRSGRRLPQPSQKVHSALPSSASCTSGLAATGSKHVAQADALARGLSSGRSGHVSLGDSLRLLGHPQLPRLPPAKRSNIPTEGSDHLSAAWVKFVIGLVFGSGTFRGLCPVKGARLRRVSTPPETGFAMVPFVHAQVDDFDLGRQCVWHDSEGSSCEAQKVPDGVRAAGQGDLPVCSSAWRRLGRLADATQEPGVHYASRPLASFENGGTLREEQHASQGDPCSTSFGHAVRAPLRRLLGRSVNRSERRAKVSIAGRLRALHAQATGKEEYSRFFLDLFTSAGQVCRQWRQGSQKAIACPVRHGWLRLVHSQAFQGWVLGQVRSRTCAGLCLEVPSFAHDGSREDFAGFLTKLAVAARSVALPLVVISRLPLQEWIPELGALPWSSCQAHLCQWQPGASRVLQLYGLHVDLSDLSSVCHGCRSCLLQWPRGRLKSAGLPTAFAKALGKSIAMGAERLILHAWTQKCWLPKRSDYGVTVLTGVTVLFAIPPLVRLRCTSADCYQITGFQCCSLQQCQFTVFQCWPPQWTDYGVPVLTAAVVRLRCTSAGLCLECKSSGLTRAVRTYCAAPVQSMACYGCASGAAYRRLVDASPLSYKTGSERDSGLTNQ